MCGISAVVGNLASREAETLVEALHAPIRHRGPDGEGFLYIDESMHAAARSAEARTRVALAFRRLKIVDLSEAAAQPLRTTRGTSWIIFNGEIYNYRELRGELVARGHEFRSSGDAEVALAAYEEWGANCFARFDGMWGMVIADLAQRRVVISRDRLGIKPLYWCRHGDAFLFASEIKQILNATQRREMNEPLVARYLRGNRIPVYDETFFAGIRSMPEATYAVIDLDGRAEAAPAFVPYWDLRDFVAQSGDYDASRERVRALLEETVDTHRHADVKTGCLLSGGLDSSILAVMMARRAVTEGSRVETFSFGFRERAPQFCEMPYVDSIVAAETGMVNYETTFDGGWIAAHARDAVRALEEPPLASAAVAQYRIFQLVREHDTTVVLDGEGSDEIFAGYPSYLRQLVVDRVRKRAFGDAWHQMRAIARRNERSLLGVAGSFVIPSIERRIRQPRYDWLDDAPPFPREAIDRSRDSSSVNRALFDAVRWGNIKIVLGYTDRNAMAHSVEARVPYMDHRVVELAFTLPDTFKAGEGDRKRILRDVGRDILPREVTERRDRMGFGTPEESMLRDRLLREVNSAALPMVRRPQAERFVERFQRGEHHDFRALWRLYALGIWMDEFGLSS